MRNCLIAGKGLKRGGDSSALTSTVPELAGFHMQRLQGVTPELADVSAQLYTMVIKTAGKSNADRTKQKDKNCVFTKSGLNSEKAEARQLLKMLKNVLL